MSKATWGAFQGTDLDAQLREADVTQVVLDRRRDQRRRGVHGPGGARHGYHVVLVTDVMTDMDPENHRHSVEKIFPRIGETTTTAGPAPALDAAVLTARTVAAPRLRGPGGRPRGRPRRSR